MRIAYHHRTLGDGAEGVHIAEIVRALRLEGHDVRIHALVGERCPRASARAPSCARWVAALRRLLPRSLYEAAEIGTGLFCAARLLASIRSAPCHAIYERYGLANVAGTLVARALGRPLLLEVNSPLALERERYEGGLAFPKLAARLELAIFRAADRCLAVSSPLRDHLVARGVEPRRVVLLPNGVEPGRFDPEDRGDDVRRELGLGGRPVIGFLGVVRPWHGIDLLLAAFAGAAPRDSALLIIGDGPGCAEVAAFAESSGLRDRIRVTGRVPHDEIPRYLAAVDVAVSPRATFYASPMKIPEYMAAGRTVVAPRMPNIEDLVDDERTGLLFEPESTGDLGRKIARALAAPALRRRLGAAARHEVETRLNWRANARRIAVLAEEALLERRGIRVPAHAQAA